MDNFVSNPTEFKIQTGNDDEKNIQATTTRVQSTQLMVFSNEEYGLMQQMNSKIKEIGNKIECRKADIDELEQINQINEDSIIQSFDKLIDLIKERKKIVLQTENNIFNLKKESFKQDITNLIESQSKMKNQVTTSLNELHRNAYAAQTRNENDDNGGLFPIIQSNHDQESFTVKLNESKQIIDNYMNESMANLSDETVNIKFINDNQTTIEQLLREFGQIDDCNIKTPKLSCYAIEIGKDQQSATMAFIMNKEKSKKYYETNELACEIQYRKLSTDNDINDDKKVESEWNSKTFNFNNNNEISSVLGIDDNNNRNNNKYSIKLESIEKHEYYQCKLICKHNDNGTNNSSNKPINNNNNNYQQLQTVSNLFYFETSALRYNNINNNHKEIEWIGGWKGVGLNVRQGYCCQVNTWIADTIFNCPFYKYKFSIQITDHNRTHGSFIEAVIGLTNPNDASKGVWSVPNGSFRLFNIHPNSKTAIVTTGNIVDIIVDFTTCNHDAAAEDGGLIRMILRGNQENKKVLYEKSGFKLPLVPVLSMWSQGGVSLVASH